MSLLTRLQTQAARRGVKLHPWQTEGFCWMRNRETEAAEGGLLGDEPGLGKTYTALSLVLADQLERKETSTLVVVPTSVIYQWVEAAELLLGLRETNPPPTPTVSLYYGQGRKLVDSDSTDGYHGLRVVVTTYGILQRDEALLEASWDRVILDEVHYIKNYRSRTSLLARRLDATFRWGLTGTPYQNSEVELASLFRFVYGIRSNQRHIRINDQLERLCQEAMLRRCGDCLEVGQSPRPSEVVAVESNTANSPSKYSSKRRVHVPRGAGLHVETTGVEFRTPSERRVYQTISRNVSEEYQSMLRNPSASSVEVFELLLRLRQASQHPSLALSGLQRKTGSSRICQAWPPGRPSSKMEGLCSLISEHPTESSLVFSCFRQELLLLEESLRSRFSRDGITVYRLDGSLQGELRGELLRQIARDTTEQRPFILLLQTRAGGVGLNLQGATRVYLMSPDWNPSNDIQAIARAYRLGQGRAVYVKTLVLVGESSIDQKILKIQGEKNARMSELLGERSRLEGSCRMRFNRDVWRRLFVEDGCGVE
jgi:SNF2 family DNA or RNA helicase